MKLHLKLNENLPWLWSGIMIIFGGFFSMYSVQYMLLEKELFQKTSADRLVLNALCCMVMYLVILFISNNLAVSCITAHCLIWILGMINFFVYEFRGNEFSVSDFSSVFTGLSVASKYKFTINARFVHVIIASAIFIIFSIFIRVKFKSPLKMRIINALLILVCVTTVGVSTKDALTETWEQKGTYRNGYILNLMLEARDSFVSAPDGYKDSVVESLEDEYSKADSGLSAGSKKPHIIVIMNESFADLRVLGDFTTNRKFMPFYDSLYENTTKGYALSSVYGAKTPNSEWEYLTGNSMAFLPSGSVVYEQYIDKNPYSLVQTLKEENYNCIAMHPYYETGWKRNSIYPSMGFDELHFIDDFDQSKLIRDYITDEEFYSKLIERFEKREKDESLFIFGITMQNHGGYGEKSSNFDQKIYKFGTSYADGNQYLSLIYESDKALEKLIAYFEKVDEPVEIVFFGDHQPGLCSQFTELLNGKGLSGLSMKELGDLYTVPFMIWTNYESAEETIDITSLNYLSTMTLEKAGISLPAYNRFLSDLMKQVPAMNERGYYSLKRGKYIHYEEAQGEEADWIDKYNMLEYNCIFDRDRSEIFFPEVRYK